MATDPPYLVDYQGGQHPASEANGGAESKDKHWDTYIDHEHSVEFYVDFLRTALDHALDEDAAIYQWFGIMRTEVIWQSWREVGLLPHQVLIWKKTRSVLTYSHFMWDYEPMMYGWREGHMPKTEAAGRRQGGLGDRLDDRGRRLGHPPDAEAGRDRQAPDHLPHQAGRPHLRALLRLRHGADRRRGDRARICYAIEQSPQFVDVAVARWEAFTGKQARSGREPMGRSSQPRCGTAGSPTSTASWSTASRTRRSFASLRRTAPGRPPSAPSTATSPAPRADDGGVQGRARRGLRRVTGAQAAALRAREHANQLKTALAVQNSIDRMFGDFAGERDELSDVDRFLEAMLGAD